MQPRIEILQEKKLVGNHLTMSFTTNKTFELWSKFMPFKKEIMNSIGCDLYSVEVYPDAFFENYSPENTFEKWAAVEVNNFKSVSERFDTLLVPAGLYAVFTHIGSQAEAVKTYTSIFTEWLPKSIYQIDDRPHFAVMGKNYKKDDPNSEEEIWIPIQTL